MTYVSRHYWNVPNLYCESKKILGTQVISAEEVMHLINYLQSTGVALPDIYLQYERKYFDEYKLLLLGKKEFDHETYQKMVRKQEIQEALKKKHKQLVQTKELLCIQKKSEGLLKEVTRLREMIQETIENKKIPENKKHAILERMQESLKLQLAKASAFDPLVKQELERTLEILESELEILTLSLELSGQ